ncbi:Long-chain base-1-phosphate phosphatase [Vermiconidia calcicola]|uniref:Long-chain base-1-phosphate phosphatase n=1 Tax=Vermiconidia calcicola TaxID=1690605 RepID=A0ACC3NG41_9PEZI|nr:Long-chain base-1-phosphate phosphatase [Vermiconidia calcicola]
MHGFFDVVVGAALGALITLFRVVLGPTYDLWNITDGWFRPGLAVVLLGFAVRFHPEPADDCPCFDDSVAFLGVIMGIETGTWHRAQSETFQNSKELSISELYAFQQQHPPKMIARLVGGVIMVFAWRAVMKPSLLKTLPAVFRFVDHWGLMIPRRYFLQASDYNQVPSLRKDDNVLPSASDIPSMLFSFRTPKRRRISVGPQSEADAREYLANRVQKRREGRLASSFRRKRTRQSQSTIDLGADVPSLSPKDSVEDPTSAIAANRKEVSASSLQVNWQNGDLLTPPASDAGASSDSGREDEKNDRKMFSSLEKPRTHYDVEVITKLVVYAGIGWLAVEGNPMLFELFGLV